MASRSKASITTLRVLASQKQPYSHENYVNYWQAKSDQQAQRCTHNTEALIARSDQEILLVFVTAELPIEMFIAC